MRLVVGAHDSLVRRVPRAAPCLYPYPLLSTTAARAPKQMANKELTTAGMRKSAELSASH